jgi:hypothetical protein
VNPTCLVVLDRNKMSTVGEQAQVCFHLSVSFDGLKIAVGVLMCNDKSVGHKIFMSFVI